ncbi:MAG: hypothetical protein QM781_06900 [Chitinophagaceae bacterium]
MTKSFHKQALTGLLLSSILLLTATSCKKEKDNKPDTPGNTARVAEVKNEDSQVNFFYDGAGRVNKVVVKSDLNLGDETMEFQVSYQQNHISKLSAINGDELIPVYEDGKMVRADYYMSNARVAYTTYQYENDQLKRAIIYLGNQPDYEPYLGFDFEYNAAGNVSRSIAFVRAAIPGQLKRSGHVDFTYDDQTNPLFEHRQLLSLFWETVSSNNILQENHFDAALALSDRFAYNYTYKSNGLPEKATITIGLPGQPSSTSMLSYRYQ